MVGCCEHGYETSGSIISVESLDRESDYEPFVKDSVPLSQSLVRTEETWRQKFAIRQNLASLENGFILSSEASIAVSETLL
jgi:hypothetical protein